MKLFPSLAVLFAFITTFLAGRYLFRDPSPKVDEIDCLVVKKELPVGQELDESNIDESVETVRRPRDTVPADAVNDRAVLIGKKLTRTLKPGYHFEPNDLSIRTRELAVPDGLVALTICLNGTKAYTGPVPKPGEHWDVLASAPKAGDESKAVWRKIVKWVLVIRDDFGRKDPADSCLWQTVIAVTPEQAALLNDAKKTGDLRLCVADPKNRD